MKLCIRSFDGGMFDVGGLCEFVRGVGLDGVQLVCYKTFLDLVSYNEGGICEETARKIGGEIKKHGLIVPLIGAYFNPVHSDREKAARCERIFGEYLRLASDLNGCYVGSETGSFNDDKWTYHAKNRTPEALDRVVETFKRLCSVATEHGAGVAIEAAAGHVCWNIDVLKSAIDRIGDDSLRVVFDLFNLLDESNYSDYLDILRYGLEVLGDRILLFHLKGCTVVDEKPVRCAPFQGIFDYTKILQAIKAHNEHAILVFEGVTGEDIVPSIEHIRRIWDSV